ncbi:MAG TPA: zf-HC2 domain-containing protein [Polyangiaceae bacterium]
MNDTACRNELVQRERRGELSPAERAAFGAHLLSCEDCRISRSLGRDFDESAALERGDGARILALSAVARRWAQERAGESAGVNPPRRSAPFGWRRRTLLIAAAFPLLLAAGASAAFGVYRARHPEAPPAAPVAKATPAPRVVPAPITRVAPAPVTSVEVSTAAPARAVERAPQRASAAERFELANAARRGGDAQRAIQLYRELAREFPASAEAAASELRLGGLLLERGKAGSALEQFERHLKRSGALVPEALYGRGRALAALDEAARERQTWTRMLRDFPQSPYAAHARRRLEALDSARAASEE